VRKKSKRRKGKKKNNNEVKIFFPFTKLLRDVSLSKKREKREKYEKK